MVVTCGRSTTSTETTMAPFPEPLPENRRLICEPRGYCGPFFNEELFASQAGGVWFGCGTCVHCGNTVDVASELERWEKALWEREFAVRIERGAAR